MRMPYSLIKPKIVTAIVLAAGVWLGPYLVAAPVPPVSTPGSGAPPVASTATAPAQPSTTAGAIAFIPDEKGSQVLSSSILSLSIRNGNGRKSASIGTVNDLILNQHHELVGIVVGVGGFLGMGQKNVGIPWSAVESIDFKNRIAIVNVTKAELQRAPAFETTKEQAHLSKPGKALHTSKTPAK